VRLRAQHTYRPLRSTISGNHNGGDREPTPLLEIEINDEVTWREEVVRWDNGPREERAPNSSSNEATLEQRSASTAQSYNREKHAEKTKLEGH